MPGQQLTDAAKERVFARDRTCAQELGQGGPIRLGLDQPAGEDGLDFRRKQERGAGHAPIERRYAQAIPNQEEAAAARVPDRKREHAAESVHALLAPLLVRVDDRFGIGRGPIDMSVALELSADRGVVVDFAVEDGPETAILFGIGC
jgi:hypothetical protein